MNRVGGERNDRYQTLARGFARCSPVAQGGFRGGEPPGSRVASPGRKRPPADGLAPPDDLPRAPNSQGAVAFAFAEANGRTTQVFINLTDNSGTLDAQGSAPLAHVVEGMDVVRALNGEYGELSGAPSAPVSRNRCSRRGTPGWTGSSRGSIGSCARP
jgi:cyclophilin family peptidyl-prolyl cis-trans isomerase